MSINCNQQKTNKYQKKNKPFILDYNNKECHYEFKITGSTNVYNIEINKNNKNINVVVLI